MAAGPRPVLLLAAFALLVVLASCNSGGMLPRRPWSKSSTPSSPIPPVYTFGWALISIHRVDFNRSCVTACARYGLAAVQSPSAALCQYTSPAAKGTVYGTWTPAGTGNPPADDDTCRAALANGTQIDSAGEAVTTYACGCCGAINRRGFAPACPADTVAYIPSTESCPSTVSWTGSAGGDGNKVCLRATNDGAPGAPVQFGTVYSNTTCVIYDDAPAADWQRVCMRVAKL